MTDAAAPKCLVALSLDAETVDRARRQGQDLSAMVEGLLREHLATREAGASRRAADHARFTRDFIERHGDWGEEFRTI